MKAYLANGLFSLSDRMFNKYLADLLRKKIKNLDLFVPQEQEINDKSSYANSEMIAELDTNKLLESDILIAVIDGVEIDAGVATEIGVFYNTGKPIVALYTDVRKQGRDNNKKIEALIADGNENQFMYRNLYTVGIIKKRGTIVDTVDELIEEIEKIEKSLL